MEYKVTYNYPENDKYEFKTHWLTGCEIIGAESFLEAQNKFRKKYPVYVIRDIELLN